MKIFPQLIVCEHCDSVCRRLALVHGEVARCERCGVVLYRADRLNIEQWLSLTVAAAIAFLLANTYPVVRISLQGLHNEATLWQSIAGLAHGEAAPIAVAAAVSVIVVPLLQIVLLGWVLLFAWTGRCAPAFAGVMKALSALRPWSMVEVCLLGVLVAIIKLSSYLEVVAGVGMWATAALTVLITIIASRDIHWLWELAEDWAA
ncbi:MAG: Paraquat-inducible protein [Gammaproteobacteria bacterium]|jgi:paraquat-inducible protein A|nr:Paraquat-inducible protein [Gammaproteobacteria bacterium]